MTAVVEAEEGAAEVIAGEEVVETGILTVVAEAEEDEDSIEESNVTPDLPHVVETLEKETLTVLHHRENPIPTFLLAVVADAMIAEGLLHQYHALLLRLDQIQALGHHLLVVAVALHQPLVVDHLRQRLGQTDIEDGEVEAEEEEEVLIGGTTVDLPLILDPDLGLGLPKARVGDLHLRRPVYHLHQDLGVHVVTQAQDLGLSPAQEVEAEHQEERGLAAEKRQHQ